MEIVEVEKKSYRLTFDDADVPGSGYAFPCDKHGNILLKKLPGQDIEALTFCIVHPERWTMESRNGRVVEVTNLERYGICPHCGAKVYLYGEGYMGAFLCECGRWYTLLGQEVRSPLEWKDLDEPLDESSYY